MAYEKLAEEHERLIRLRFALQRRYDACPEGDVPKRQLLRDAIAQVNEEIERVRTRA